MLLRIREEIREGLIDTTNQDEFLPFLNERNSVGKIIKPTKRKKVASPEEILQSLKMTTKEFFSQKRFQKDLRKFNLLKNSLRPRELDVDKEINDCERILTNFESYRKQQTDDELFYNKDRKTQSRIQQIRCSTSAYKRKTAESAGGQRLKRPGRRGRALHKTNVELFRQVDQRMGVGSHSEFMANWTNCSIPYRQHIESKSRSPDRSNYVPQVHNLYLKRSQTQKKLKNSLYDPFL